MPDNKTYNKNCQTDKWNLNHKENTTIADIVGIFIVNIIGYWQDIKIRVNK